jgi:hypothetical protein
MSLNTENSSTQTKTEKKTSADKKWGSSVMKLGFCMIPSLLFRAQKRLGLNPTQLAILLQLADYWWEADNKPYPSKQSLSERLGIGTRQIQRYIAEMEQAGLVTRIERVGDDNRKLSNHYDLSGLVEKLKQLEPEFRAVEEEAKAKRQKVSRRGGLKQ